MDEFDLAGIIGEPSVEVRPDRVAGAPATFECVLTQQVRLQTRDGRPVDTWVTFGEVVAVHLDESLLADGIYQTARARPVLRGGGPTAYFEITPGGPLRHETPP